MYAHDTTHTRNVATGQVTLPERAGDPQQTNRATAAAAAANANVATAQQIKPQQK